MRPITLVQNETNNTSPKWDQWLIRSETSDIIPQVTPMVLIPSETNESHEKLVLIFRCFSLSKRCKYFKHLCEFALLITYLFACLPIHVVSRVRYAIMMQNEKCKQLPIRYSSSRVLYDLTGLIFPFNHVINMCERASIILLMYLQFDLVNNMTALDIL